MDLNTLSAKELTIHFNKLVTESHPTIPCITVWKASKAALIAKIEALPSTPVKADREDILSGKFAETEEVIADKPTKPAKVVAKKEKPAKAEKTEPRKGQSDGEVSAYFAAHGLNPKVMRSKLRRAGFSAPYTLDQVKSLAK